MEACAAFSVPQKYVKITAAGTVDKHARMRQDQVVDAVLAAVRQSRQQLCKPASARDECRRQRMAGQWRGCSRRDITTSAKQCGLGGSLARGGAESLKRRVFVRTCPEELRVAVVSEFIELHARLP